LLPYKSGVNWDAAKPRSDTRIPPTLPVSSSDPSNRFLLCLPGFNNARLHAIACYFSPLAHKSISPRAMRGLSAGTGTTRWLLLSDLHFKHHDLDRVRQTAEWIVAEAERHRVGRAVICGDLLTSRTMQQTHVLSACYRFISRLSDVVPHVHVLLGNHDLAYRRDYQTTALDALNINRLAPYVSLHSDVAGDEWDGRRVLLLPFREEQDELADAVAALGPKEASQTVAFAHLAINKAITQRHVVGAGAAGFGKPHTANPITHRGLMGPDPFASLARTFTGHFHSHQTIVQKHIKQLGHNEDDLQGSVTYLGSPLQLTWADLDDEQRGVVLFDPETLQHKMLTNPHAVGYMTADLQQVLDGQVDESAVTDKHVMLLGELSRVKYVTARDKLLSLGVRSVRNWTPIGLALKADHQSFGGLGTSAPASDGAAQRLGEPAIEETGPDKTKDGVPGPEPVQPETEPRAPRLDLAAEARKYVESLELDESLFSRREELVRVGQRMIQVSHEMADQDDQAEGNYQDFLDRSSQAVGTRTATELAGPSTHVFVAEPRTLTVTNFLGVQGTLKIDFQQDFPRGLTFLVGENGSGKSTLVEAMVWCQFGRCLRSGLAVNDVVNDKVGKNCSVVLEFANGYAIARHRKHKGNGNRVIVTLHGETQPQLEHPDARTTQTAIDRLLGTHYEKYVRTVVLGHENAASFLNSTSVQRRDLIEASLGLSMLDQCGQVSRLLIRDVDKNVDEAEGKLEGLLRMTELSEQRLEDLAWKQKQIEEEIEEAVASLEAADEANNQSGHGVSDFDTSTADFEQKIAAARKGVQDLLAQSKSAELNMAFHLEISTLQGQTYIKQENLQRLEYSYKLLQEQKHAEPMSWLGRLRQQLSQRLEAMAAAHPVGSRKLVHAVKISILHFRLLTVRGLSYIFGTPRDGSQGDSAQDHGHEAAICNLREDIKKSMSRLQKNLSIGQATGISEQLTQARERQRRIFNAREALQQQVTLKQREAATYTDLIETERSSLHSFRSENDVLSAKLHLLAADRELFAFWSSALAKPAATSTFREHILVQSLSELNGLLAQVLTVLYDDTRHARAMSTGMLRSLFDSDSDSMTNSGSVLDRSLAVNPSLAYGKRSGGERKRQLEQAGSAHRAHYVLADEAAVVRCWVVVITHSRFLVERDPEEDTGKVLVLVTEGRRIGV
ncbi:P-loop containing nucleoside triphosphate hydrolase protein, partial [Dactylonectria estremocensis]